jgi:hypothetical protein
MDQEEIKRHVANAELYNEHVEVKADFEGCGRRLKETVGLPLAAGSDLELGQVIFDVIGSLNDWDKNIASQLKDINEAERIAEQALQLQNDIDAFISRTGWNIFEQVHNANEIANVFAAVAKSMRQDKRLEFETENNQKAKFAENAAERLGEIYQHYFGQKPTLGWDDINVPPCYTGSLVPFIREVSAVTGVEINLGSLKSARARMNKRNKNS